MAFINGCGGIKTKAQSRNILLTTNQQTVTPNEGYDGISELSIDPSEILQSKLISDRATITPDDPYVAFSDVTINVCKPFCLTDTTDTATDPEHVAASVIELTIPSGTNLRSTPPRYMFIINATPDQNWSCWDGLHFARLARYTSRSNIRPTEYANRIKYAFTMYNKVWNVNYGSMSRRWINGDGYLLWPNQDNSGKNITLNDDGSLTISIDSLAFGGGGGSTTSGQIGQLLPLVDGAWNTYIHGGTYKVIMIWDVEDSTGLTDEIIRDNYSKW